MPTSAAIASSTIGDKRPVSGPSARDFLLALFRYLDATGTRYCVLHSWDNLPEELPSDLDIGVHPEDRAALAGTIRHLGEDGFSPIQLINHNVNGFYFVFCWESAQGLRTAAVDVIFEHRRGGLIADDGAKLTANRERCGEFWVASPPVEFGYLLLKKAVKGKVKPEQVARLQRLAQTLGRVRAEEIAGELFSARWSKRIVSACMDGSLPTLLSKIKSQIWKTAVTRKPLDLGRYLAGDTVRWVRRWMRPNGLFVAILGPDGAGKSSAIAGLHAQIGGAFWEERYFHLRPQVLAPRKSAAPVTNPHAMAVRGSFRSSLQLTALLADYFLGYAGLLRQLKPRSCLLVFDRYFHDVLVDPKRFRYGGPVWLARLYAKLVPEPDLLVVLDVDLESILARKVEVPVEEVNRQRETYRRLPVAGNQLRIVSANGSREEVAHQLASQITGFMSARFRKMYPEWIGANQ